MRFGTAVTNQKRFVTAAIALEDAVVGRLQRSGREPQRGSAGRGCAHRVRRGAPCGVDPRNCGQAARRRRHGSDPHRSPGAGGDRQARVPAMSSSDDADIGELDRDGALREAIARVDGEQGTRADLLRGAQSAARRSWRRSRSRARAAAPSARDRDILNYALTLEYLQSAFYTETDRQGALRGKARRASAVLGAVERAHVTRYERARSAAVAGPLQLQGRDGAADAVPPNGGGVRGSRRRGLQGAGGPHPGEAAARRGSVDPLGRGSSRGLDALPVRDHARCERSTRRSRDPRSRRSSRRPTSSPHGRDDPQGPPPRLTG